MKTYSLFIGAAVLLLAGALTGRKYIMQYFKLSEFGEFGDKLNPALPPKLDKFRELWGEPVNISQHPEAVGRHGGDSTSQHNVDRFGHTNAVDIFPLVNGERITRKADIERAVAIAKKVGFTGIGVYTDTFDGAMMHLDIRSGSRVATWGRVAGQYVGIEQAISDVQLRYT